MGSQRTKPVSRSASNGSTGDSRPAKTATTVSRGALVHDGHGRTQST